MILAIDTSLGSAVAVVDLDGVTRGEASSPNALGHAEIIGTLIEGALAEASVTPRDITHVAAGMGPGPFTGLRIGIAAARTFALARAVPVIAVASHDAAALPEFETAAPGPIAIVTDARRREFAYTVYAGLAEGLPVRTTEPALAPRDDLDARLLSLGLPANPVQRVDVTSISAGALGRLAGRMLAAGIAADRHAGDGSSAEPLYLRSPDVTLGHAPKRVGV
ncbi:MAG: tRNA (adenosine(37)-N6)-threonylcarbamoyltransferase complex dimerization subunit type 1 TsaB [Microbacterium sp.]|uniref:tRNA (adenosine(37)-N6)-threonylcarbamoyltransferase complex dimerization subunit type 1 TsaB n=1 Tax=Microbacterium sp. TaxID=51671 RepID=UPI00271F0301|nr:tRNA (adenosine(37)-N6)-threonylcarbamoyltransferase complex dimerization subunit type 1 TsaB [Microbacterium sp.]MDO8383449.1 tRNA (adenosine(37)-N6)-threonylcarbamoyltransferase complex dimerization subunit type 1 TsaB [Microbacterium sp.]